jgi:hypothetical protein
MQIQTDRPTQPPMHLLNHRHDTSPPTRGNTKRRTSGTNDNDRYVLTAQPGQAAGAAKTELPALSAHRPKRPARLRSPKKAPLPDRPTVRSGPDGAFKKGFSCPELRRRGVRAGEHHRPRRRRESRRDRARVRRRPGSAYASRRRRLLDRIDELIAVLLLRQQREHGVQPAPGLWNGREPALSASITRHLLAAEDPEVEHDRAAPLVAEAAAVRKPAGRRKRSPDQLAGDALVAVGRAAQRRGRAGAMHSHHLAARTDHSDPSGAG